MSSEIASALAQITCESPNCCNRIGLTYFYENFVPVQVRLCLTKMMGRYCPSLNVSLDRTPFRADSHFVLAAKLENFLTGEK